MVAVARRERERAERPTLAEWELPREAPKVISPKAEAEACYEEAIEQGDSAVLLRQVEPGLYRTVQGVEQIVPVTDDKLLKGDAAVG